MRSSRSTTTCSHSLARRSSDHLLALRGSRVDILNRAVARAEVDGPREALADLRPLEADPRMRSYQPYWAAKGHLLLLAGDTGPAVEALTVAIGLTTDEVAKGYLRAQLASLQTD
jgi:RNA polymerase sigma-70 factor, ECF subfamily